ncbi:aminoglycoside phosphotransferase family protein [Echinicola marina]|uniref:phosphotransferase enzyme family protein n=1 Tax=Echinicola marina TaxID=2859768 RepID=UPI001CF62334|nr:aminoglycoside phosphotransferase family protein [Echinicola marina]UCS94682.1 aminoglycoside phosphotransferase family protein [Echinicola marina]
MESVFDDILVDYGQPGAVSDVKKYGSGHIHQTYLVNSDAKQYILQNFNTNVFPFPDRIAKNLKIVNQHLTGKQLDFNLVLPMKTVRGSLFSDLDQSAYRLFPFISGECIDKVSSTEQAYLAAQAFGGFVKACIGIDTSELEEVIDGFHNLSLRYRQFENALKETKVELHAEAQELVEFYKRQVLLVRKYKYYEENLPLRVTHNDTKINNVIYDKNFSKINAVIDLDTVMPGYIFYDFGDLVRTVSCTEEEASLDWDKIDVDLDKYAALLKGFVAALGSDLTAEEKNSLPFGGEMMACIMGLRFLTDYLNGNIYYPIAYPEHNLHRAKNQSLLLKALQNKREDIDQMMKEV